jgi:hypothetical protein
MSIRPSLTPGAASAVTVRGDIDLASIPATDWNDLTQGIPLLSHAFLSALHETGCAAPVTGWRPSYLSAWRNGMLAGALPLYAKTHSYGEYVFDWAWADAFHRYGRRYYPKLVARFRSPRRLARVSSRATTRPAPRYFCARWKCCARKDPTTVRASRRCTFCFRRRKKRTSARAQG